MARSKPSTAVLTDRVREALLPPPNLTIDEWAERSIVIPRGMSAEPGPLQLDRTPYLREILRTVQSEEVEEVALCFSTQVGKTLALILIALYYADQDPFPCLWVAPRDEDATTINTDRFQPLIEASPVLSRHLTGAAHDMTRGTIRLNGSTIDFSGALSPAGLASRAIRLLLTDETDKYPQYTGREASPLDLARERTRTFVGARKIIKTSTPTTERGYIWKETQAGDERQFYVPCPLCGHFQVFVMGTYYSGSPGVKWPKDERDPEKIVDERLAWYECESCHGKITDSDKPPMLRDGRWVPRGCTIDSNGEIHGHRPSVRRSSFRLNAIYSPWLTFSEVAAEFLRSKDFVEKLMNFRNSWQALPWEDRVEELRDAQLRTRVCDYEQKTVPEDVHILTAGIDVQVSCLYMVIRGWCALGESYLVRAMRVENWGQLEAVLFRTPYLFEKSRERAQIGMICIDSGDQTDTVYEFCRRNECQATKGASKPTRPWWTSKGKDRRQTKLLLFDTDFYKVKLHRMMKVRDGDPGAWHIPKDLPAEYFPHMVAEQRVRVQDKKTGKSFLRWKVIPDDAPNHYFDCEVLNLLAADVRDFESRWLEAPQRRRNSQGAKIMEEEKSTIPRRRATRRAIRAPARSRVF